MDTTCSRRHASADKKQGTIWLERKARLAAGPFKRDQNASCDHPDISLCAYPCPLAGLAFSGSLFCSPGICVEILGGHREQTRCNLQATQIQTRISGSKAQEEGQSRAGKSGSAEAKAAAPGSETAMEPAEHPPAGIGSLHRPTLRCYSRRALEPHGFQGIQRHHIAPAVYRERNNSCLYQRSYQSGDGGIFHQSRIQRSAAQTFGNYIHDYLTP